MTETNQTQEARAYSHDGPIGNTPAGRDQARHPGGQHPGRADGDHRRDQRGTHAGGGEARGKCGRTSIAFNKRALVGTSHTGRTG
eukprot:5859876-Pyramimonas_sp.AAC.1